MRFVEKWILDVLHNGGAGLSLLLMKRTELEHQWNVEAGGITPDRVITSLQKLHVKKFICICEWPVECKLTSEDHRVLNDADGATILSQLHPSNSMSWSRYSARMTLAGALQWEHNNRFDWRKYSIAFPIKFHETEHNRTRWKISATELDLVIWEVEQLPSSSGVILDYTTIAMTLSSPFEIFWWLQVPAGWTMEADAVNVDTIDTEALIQLEEGLERELDRLHKMAWKYDLSVKAHAGDQV